MRDHFKDLDGKIRRFLHGRITASRDIESGHIPPSCLHDYPPLDSSRQPRHLVILYSGDGGWANLTTSVSKAFQQDGTPVTGIDCMHYFWKEKSPQEAATELANLIESRSRKFATRDILLVGYSMGADVLPSIVRQLPREKLSQVKHLILLSPSHRGLLKFRFIGWLGFATPERHGHPLLSDLKALAPIPITCIAGEKEHDTLLDADLTALAATHRLPGGHHYGSDYSKLAALLISITDY